MIPELPKITQARLQVVNADSKTIGDGTTDDPTEEEKAWIDIIASTAPELDVKKKRVSTCAIADVVEYDTNAIKVKYDGVVYTIKKPTNSLQIARARERSAMAAFETLVAQFCVLVNGAPCKTDFSNLPVEAIILLSNVADRFFFTPYL
jgi:uncharacterized membrane protein